MPEHHHFVSDDNYCETKIAHTPDGTFECHRFQTHVDEDTGLPVYGRWSPWYRTEVFAKDGKQRIYSFA